MTGPEIALAGIAGADLIEQAPAAIILTDSDGVIVTWNRQAERLFGYEAAEVVGRTAEEFGGELRSRIQSGGVWHGEVPAVRKDGTRIRINVVGAPIRGAGGRRAGALSIALEHTGDDHAQAAQMRLELLLQASEMLARSLDPEAGLQGVARLAVSWLAEVCAIDLLDEQGGMRRVAVADADRTRAPVTERLRAFPPDPDGVHMSVALREGRTEVLAELTDEILGDRLRGTAHIEVVRQIDARSAVILPLAARGRTLGAMVLLACGDRPPFSPDDVAVAEELARRTAVAVDNSVLLREARERADAAQRLQRLSDAALAHVELDDLLEEILALLRHELGSDAAAVLLMEPDGQRLTVRATSGLETTTGRGLRVPADDPSAAGAVGAGAPVVIQDPTDDDAGPLLSGRGVRTLMTTPLRVGPRTVGVLQTDWLAPRALGQDEVDLVGLAAGRIALAVDRARAYEAEHDARLRLELLARTSDVLGESLDFRSALGDLARLIVPHLADWCAIDLVEANGFPKISVAHTDSAKVELARELVRRYPPDPDDAAGAGAATVLPGGADELAAGAPAAFLERTADDEHRAILRGLGMRSVIVVPLTARGRTHGTLTLVTAESGRVYGDDDVAFATELARRAATAIDTARLYQDRDQVARTLQRSLLPPDLPDVPGVELAAVYHPAGGGGDVGGDFYDAFETADSGLYLAIGDVCGKGAPAAALTGIARHTVRAAAVRERSPKAILRTLNQALLRQMIERRFCTVAVGRLETAPGGARLTVCCGGHPPPLLIRRDGTVEEAGTPGTLLGIYEHVQLSDHTVELEPGDAVVFYTDGVTEERRQGHMFGEERLGQLLRSSAGLSAAGIADRIERAVLEFTPGPPADDVAVIVLRLTGNA
jgi:PAS domain S-box-containing protein